MVDVLSGLKPSGLALMDSEKSPAALLWSAGVPVYAVPATRIALEVFGQPYVNPAMLGAWAAATGEVSVEAIERAYQHRFPGSLGEKNRRAAQMGYDFIRAGATPVQVKKSEQIPGVVIKWEGKSWPARRDSRCTLPQSLRRALLWLIPRADGGIVVPWLT